LLPDLTVADNMRVATYALSPEAASTGIAYAVELFPELKDRWRVAGRFLSGGEQQMVVLAQAIVSRPKTLLVDELSLGLAPVVVAQLLEVIADLKAAGTTMILVEQSVNVALSVADTAVWMEKGEIRFRGPTADLLDREDLVRAVFLGGGAPSR
jgi:branched-chain amino acid transport system ATP-binding protein